MTGIAENLARVKQQIAQAAEAAGREPESVRLLPVSKTVPSEVLREALVAGETRLAENKVQEAKRKWQEMADCDVEWAVIGHLQTNKAKDVAEFASEFQALDSVRLAQALDTRLQAAGRTLDVLVQVNTSGEESKSGLASHETLEFLRELPQFSSLRVQGLMTLAINSPDEDAVRACFRTLRELRDEGAAENLVGAGELSMGMSGDFALAIAEGSTCVRVGSAIFGARNYAV
ncbi:MAG: YggS family pyridoxal phosphate-dependent enzyme [Microbacteriaceae bacterium]|nr:YggS family pyridoxal phosphate-dependent enzyme [Microbacteriaceae bacterium]